MFHYLGSGKSGEGNEVKQAVRLARSVPRTNLSEVESVDIKWPDGSTVRVYLVWRRQPHGGCALLLRCSRCGLPQLQLYGAGLGDDGHFYVLRRPTWEFPACAWSRY